MKRFTPFLSSYRCIVHMIYLVIELLKSLVKESLNVSEQFLNMKKNVDAFELKKKPRRVNISI